MECMKGNLNLENKCEFIDAKPPRAVCSPGFFELDGLCIQRRGAPCDDSPDGDSPDDSSLPWTEKSKSMKSSTEFSGNVYQKESDLPNFTAKKVSTYSTIFPTLQASNEPEMNSVEWELPGQSFDEFTASEARKQYPFRQVTATTEMLSTTGLEQVSNYGMDEWAFSTNYEELTEHEHGQRWDTANRISGFSRAVASPEFLSNEVIGRRLEAAKLPSDQSMGAVQGSELQNSGRLSPILIASEYLSKENLGAVWPRTEAPPVRSSSGPLYVNLMWNSPVRPASSLLQKNNLLVHDTTPGIPAIRPQHIPVYRPWHDQRFYHEAAGKQGPFARQQLHSANLFEKGFETHLQPHVRSEAPQKVVTDVRWRANDPAGADGAGSKGKRNSHSQASADIISSSNSVFQGENEQTVDKESGTANVNAHQHHLVLDGRHFFRNGPAQKKRSGAKEHCTNEHCRGSRGQLSRRSSRDSSSQRSFQDKTDGDVQYLHRRRLEALDYIPGCYEVCQRFKRAVGHSNAFYVDRSSLLCLIIGSQ